MSRFRVLQFNMQFGQGWDATDPDHAPVRLERTIDEIKSHDADVILLQEVEWARPNGQQLTPPPNYTRLAAELKGYHGTFAYPKPDPRELPFGIGLAIFSRGPLRDITRVDLPSPPIPFVFDGRKTTPTDRVLIAATTTLDGHDVRLLNTHLLAFFMLGTTSLENPEQRKRLAGLLRNATGPTLLGGDFNVRHHESLAAQFGNEGFRTVQSSEITWRRQPYILDHIFHNAPLRCVGHRVSPTLASDHHALIADFEILAAR